MKSVLTFIAMVLGAVSSNFSPDCNHSADGLYPIGSCESRFLICSGGFAYVMDCPEDLVYHESREVCDWKYNVFSCGSEESYKEELGEFSGSGSGADVEVGSGDNSKESSGDLLFHNVCEQRKDGVYSTGSCTNAYYICSSNSPRHMICTTPLHYDPNQQKCSWKEIVEECNNKVMEPPIVENHETKCRENGFFSFGQCSSSFTACTNGNAIIMFCPSGLRFSSATQMCDYEHNVEECLGGSGEYLSKYNDKYGDDVDVELMTPCINMENGLYALECTPRVLSCQNGHEEIFECPANLVFNEQSLICDFPETSRKCEIEDHLLIRDSAVGTYDCSVDGIFASAICSPVYHKCLNGQLIKFECAGFNNVFSSIDAKCVDASELPQCQ